MKRTCPRPVVLVLLTLIALGTSACHAIGAYQAPDEPPLARTAAALRLPLPAPSDLPRAVSNASPIATWTAPTSTATPTTWPGPLPTDTPGVPSITPTLELIDDLDEYDDMPGRDLRVPPSTRLPTLSLAPLATPAITRVPTPILPSFVLPTPTLMDLAGLAIKPHQFWYGNKNEPRAALTFDTGQGLATVVQVLDALKAANVRATFFLMGNWAARNPTVVRRIVAEGHEVSNHSYSHPNFNQLDDGQVIAQALAAEKIIHDLTGCTTRPFLRPPFGAASVHVQQVLGRAGFDTVMWSTHGGDWLPGATPDSVRQRVVYNTGNGSIVVLHSSAWQTAQALPAIIAELKVKGLQLITLTDLLSPDPAHPLQPPCAAR